MRVAGWLALGVLLGLVLAAALLDFLAQPGGCDDVEERVGRYVHP